MIALINPAAQQRGIRIKNHGSQDLLNFWAAASIASATLLVLVYLLFLRRR